VDAYNDANAEADLGVFDAQFNLPSCTSSNGRFRKVYSGSKPVTNANEAVEISLDVQWAHAIAPRATILLVETPSNSLSSLLSGDVHRRLGGGTLLIGVPSLMQGQTKLRNVTQ
jgi:subtilase family serine protease